MGKTNFFVGILLILSLYGGTNYYIGRRIFHWLQLLYPSINATIFTVIYVCLALSIILTMSPLPTAIKGFMNWLGSHMMGIFVYLLLCLLITDLAILFGSLIKVIPNPVPPSIHFFSTLIALLLTASFVSYGIYHANQVYTVSYEVKLKKPAAAGMKIVLISDLHLGAAQSEKRLERVVKKVNALKPDLVCIAGDMFNNDYSAIQDPDRAIALLKSIKTKYGVYSSLGNHDAGKSFAQMLQLLKRSNIKLLNDEHVIIDQRLALFGRVDASPIGDFGGIKRKEISDQIASLDANLPIVVMDHRPDKINQYDEKTDLILSGHTHKGQIFPFGFVTKSIFTVDYGHYQKDPNSPHVIVTSGAGTWGMPMRVGTNNEVVSIQLQSMN